MAKFVKQEILEARPKVQERDIVHVMPLKTQGPDGKGKEEILGYKILDRAKSKEEGRPESQDGMRMSKAEFEDKYELVKK